MRKPIVIIILAMMLSMLFNLPVQFTKSRAASRPGSGLPMQSGNTVSINDVSLVEGNIDASSMTFTVTLTAPGEHPSIGVQYTTADGPPPSGATAPSDYNSVSNLLVFPGGLGGATMTISVPINGDTAVEPDETFFVNLTIVDSPATLSDGQGVGTIINDDAATPLPTITINDVSVTEGNSETVNAIFTVSLSAPSSSAVTVNFATADGTATVADIDYLSRTGTVTFPANDATPKNISIPVVGDIRDEPNETFLVNLSNPVGATLADGQGVGTIINDDLTCSSSILPTTNLFEREGGTGSVNVTAPTGCNWTAVSNASWITVTSGASGSGNGTVNYSVAVNTGDTRNGTITIAGQTFTVFQRSCINEFTPISQTFPSSGGPGSVALSAEANCNWTAVSQEAWITVTSGATGSGNGTITYSVASHSGAARSGRILIAGQIFTVIQDGLANCQFTISPTEQTFPHHPTFPENEGIVMVNGPAACTWTATSHADWIRLPLGSSGIGSGNLRFRVDENTGPPRTGTITVAGQTFTVLQGRCPVSLEPTRKEFTYEGGTGELHVHGECPFNAVSNDPWITLTEVNTLSGIIKYTVAPNPGAYRLGSIMVDNATFEVAQFTQGSCSIELVPSEDTFYASGANNIIGNVGNIAVTIPSSCKWTAISRASWITITSIIPEGLVQYSVAPNTTGRFRVGTIEIRDESLTAQRIFTVNQRAALPPCVQAISPETVSLDGEQAVISVQVTAPADCLWDAIGHAPWIESLFPKTASGNKTISYLVKANPGAVRSSIIDIGGKTHSVTQHVGSCPVETICQLFPTGCEQQAPTARSFRDQVLVQTTRGKRYTELYYKFSTEAVGIMMLNPLLLLRSRDMMTRYMPVVESMIKGEQVALTTGDLEEIESFLNAFAAKGSAEFRETIQGLHEDLRNERVHQEFSITITDGGKRDLPAKTLAPLVKQTSQILPPFGLFWLIFNFIVRRRRKLGLAFRRVLCATVALSVLGGQGLAISNKSSLAGSHLISTKAPKQQPSPASQLRAQVPLSFEANNRQRDSQVKFISRGAGYNLFLSPTEATFQLRKTNCGLEKKITTDYLVKAPIPDSAVRLPQSEIVRMKLAGANPGAKMRGLDELPSLANYFIGKDPAQWRAAVPTFAKVQYENVYQGIDLIYYGNQGELEYDFKLAPGANPAAIGLNFEGADKLEIDRQGDLVLQVAGSEVRQRKPFAYQEGDGGRREVACRYRLIQNPKSKIQNLCVGFEVGNYDATRPLVIDPVFVFSTYLGGAGNDEGNSIAVDAAGNIYIAGFTDSINFPSLNASQPGLGGGEQDAFVMKLDPTGSRVIYSTYLGGNGQDNATSLALDASGNACITGFTDSTNFPTRNALQAIKKGNFNTFVMKLNATGTLLSSTLLGGSASDYGSSIAVDRAGNLYVAGLATSNDFPRANALQPQSGGAVDLYLAKLNSSASSLLYSTYLGASGIDATTGIAVDSAGNAYVTGLTASRDFRTVNALQATHGGGSFDAFVMKVNPAGSEVIYATYLGGSGEDRGFRIAVDAGGNVYVTGDTDSNNFPVKNGAQQTNGGSADAFVVKLNASGNALTYSTYLGGSGIDGATAIAIDAAGSAYVTGFTASANFPTVNSMQRVFGGGSFDGFVAKLSASGSSLGYATYLGASGIDSGFGIVTDVSGNAYVMGVTTSTGFPVVAPLQPANGGGTADIFIAKIQGGPSITGAMKSTKNLIVTGGGFDTGATILLNGEPQKTSNDSQNPSTVLIGKKVYQKIASGQQVTLQVRNADGALSNEFKFTRP
jgi:hypothetical protein